MYGGIFYIIREDFVTSLPNLILKKTFLTRLFYIFMNLCHLDI
jgi:hypothetical protein